mmetsp:Transcript_5949/g.12198  ORF Transcript_5949/g.12198 Transcript_5949/m.12198 type:complete len:82 (+) Transcript_5949:317-562(+)
MASHPETKIDCSKVYVKRSTFSNEKTGMFDGAFAAVPFKEGARCHWLLTVFEGFVRCILFLSRRSTSAQYIIQNKIVGRPC